MTFDIISDVFVGSKFSWQHFHEITALCRSCNRPSLMLICLETSALKSSYGKNGAVTKNGSDVSDHFRLERHISIADIAAKASPSHLPPQISDAFEEGTRCLAIGCTNAGASMFRLCLDLATRGLLPNEEDEGGPSKHERRNLAPRLRWLFENQHLPSDMKELSAAVKEHGDEGAHDGWLDENDSEDLYDFAFALLERLYSNPARLAEAKQRREARRSNPLGGPTTA